MAKETQRTFGISFDQSSACTNDENCPIKPLLEGLELTKEGFFALAQKAPKGTDSSINYLNNSEGQFHTGEIDIRCRTKPRAFECGVLKFKVSYPQAIPEGHV